MRILAVTRGVQGCGKSTWVTQNGLDPYSINPDLIRLQYQGPVLNSDGTETISGKNDKQVWEHLFGLLEKRMERGELTIVQGCHSKPSDFAKYKELIEKYRYRFYTIDFSDVPLDVCKERNRGRNKIQFVPEDALDKVHSRLANLEPPAYANLIKPDQFLEAIKWKLVDFNKYNNIYITSDIHGCWDPLNKFLIEHSITDNDLLIINGDFLDRGLQHKEVLKFWVEHFNRPNFIYMDSNHHTHFHKYAYGEVESIRSKEFIKNTIPDIEGAIEEYKYSLGLFRNLCRKVNQVLYFEYGGRKWCVNHGGIPCFPERGLEFLPSETFIRGAGKYEDDLKVIESWNRLMPEDHYQCFGHRRVNNTLDQNGRVFNTNGDVELGGKLKVVHLHGSEIDFLEYENSIFRAPEIVVSPEPLSGPVASGGETVKEFIDKIKRNKNIYELPLGSLSSFNFSKESFYEDLYDSVPDLPRGFFVDSNYNIVARGMVKAYNYRERSRNQDEFLADKLVFPVKAYVKYNGFLGLLGYNSAIDQLTFASKSTTQGDFARIFKDLFLKNYEDSINDIKKFLKDNNVCLTFEVISNEDPHIIDIDKEGLVLLDCYSRAIKTEKHDHLFPSLSERFGFEVKELAYTFNSWGELSDFLHLWDSKEETYKGKYIEGFMIEDSAGYVFKIKGKYYRKWKGRRPLIHAYMNGRRIKEGSLLSVEDNEFYGFLRKLDRLYVKDRSLIQLRNEFLKQKQ